MLQICVNKIEEVKMQFDRWDLENHPEKKKVITQFFSRKKNQVYVQEYGSSFGEVFPKEGTHF